MSTIKAQGHTKPALLLSVLLATVLAAGCNKQSPETLVAEAKTYQQKGDDKAAIIQLKNALQAAPDNVEARYLLGTLYNKNGDPASAEKELRRALALGMSPAQVKPEIARSQLMQGQYQKVIDETAQENASADVIAMRGNAYFALAKYDLAKQSFEQASRIKPDAPEALIGLGKVAVVEKDLAAATRYGDTAVAKSPRYTEAWLFRGDLLRSQGKVDEALAAYDQALKIEPASSTVRIVKANLEISARKFAEAKADIEAAKKIAPNTVGVLYVQALLEFSEGKNAAAQETIMRVLRAAPDHMASVLLAGSIQFALGSTQQSEQSFRKYLDNNPNNLFARKMLAASLMKNGQTQRAIDLIEPALAANTKDPQLWLLAGESQMKARNFAKATEYFEKAQAIAPEAGAVHTALGMSKLAQGDSDDGVAELEKAAALGNSNSQAGMMLISTHMRQKQFDKALAVARNMEKANPKDPAPHNLMGGIYLNKGDKAAARASFEKALAVKVDYYPAVNNLVQFDLQEKKYDAAKKRIETYLATNKADIQATVLLANIAVQAGQKEQALAVLEKAVADNPDSIPAARALASYYAQTNEKAKAVALVSKMQKARPSDFEALELLAQAQMQAGDAKAALDSYTKLAAIQPESAPIQFRIAAVQMQLKNTEGAYAALAKSLRLDPAYPEAQVAMANLEGAKGNFDAALTIARNLQKQQAKLPIGFVLEGDLLAARGNAQAAVKPYEQAYALAANGMTIKKLHYALAQSGRKAEADARLQKWVTANPDDAQSRMYLAQVSMNGTQNKTAIAQLEAVVKAQPNNGAALNNLALAYQQEKDPRAQATAEKALALLPENAAVLDTLGWILAEAGNTQRALPLLHKANTLAPRAPEIRYHLAQAMAKAGDKAGARKELAVLIDSGEKFARLDDAKALMKQL